MHRGRGGGVFKVRHWAWLAPSHHPGHHDASARGAGSAWGSYLDPCRLGSCSGAAPAPLARHAAQVWAGEPPQSFTSSSTVPSTVPSIDASLLRYAQAVDSVSLPHEWQVHFDPGSGQNYYHNSSTGQTTWDPPSTVPTPVADKVEFRPQPCTGFRNPGAAQTSVGFRDRSEVMRCRGDP